MKRLLLLLCLLAGMDMISVTAQIRGNNITVTPDHKDWNCRVGETAHFSVAVLWEAWLLKQMK